MKTLNDIMQDQIEAANPLVLDNEFDDVEIDCRQFCTYQDMEMEYEAA